MRACVIGGGLAGSLLAWRLAQTSGLRIDLLLGERCRADATAASGGAVRAFESNPAQRRLAVDSMVELLGSPMLRRWADFTRVDTVCLRPGDAQTDLGDVEAALPGSARLVAEAELTAMGFAGLPAGTVGVVERSAGYLSPARLRDNVLAVALSAASMGDRVSVLPVSAGRIEPSGGGAVECEVAGERRAYDVAVVAAGAWTANLLRASGLPADGYRTKSIQFGLYPLEGWCPPIFVDEVSGLYGRPAVGGELLLGLPTQEWDVEPERATTTPALHEAAVQAAHERFPKLRLGPASLRVGAVDCYADPPILALRPVAGGEHRLFTFTGGSGGSVKTALAASRQAAGALAEDHLAATAR